MGIDVGSISAKAAVVIDKSLVCDLVMPTGYNVQKAGQKVFAAALQKAGMDETSVDRVTATGYGRKSVDFAHKVVTEITCHGAGARFLDPEVRSVVDIGGQDSKAISLDENGRVAWILP